MISHITSSSPHIYAAGSTTLPYISPNHTNPMQGALRINGTTMEVFDGMAWRGIYLNNADIGLNTEANDAINWAIHRMKQEQERYALASSNEAVRIALDQLEQARTKLELMAHLARDYEAEKTS
jgi:dipeptidase